MEGRERRTRGKGYKYPRSSHNVTAKQIDEALGAGNGSRGENEG